MDDGRTTMLDRRWLTRTQAAVSIALLAGVTAACSGTTVPYTFEGEPVCPDFAIGKAEPVRGGLKRPLHVAFKSGSDVVARVVLLGLRTETGPATPILLPDTDAEYEVEWAECENERAPATISSKAMKGSPADMKYECGEMKVYATAKVVTTQGDPARKITVAPPPAPTCWTGDAAPGSPPPAAPSASAAPMEAPTEVTAPVAPSASTAPVASVAPVVIPPAPPPPAPTPPPAPPPAR